MVCAMKLLLILILAAAGCTKDAPKANPAKTNNTTAKAPAMNVDLLRVAPPTALANEVLRYEAVEGHHFEVKAPQECGGAQPLTKTARRVECQFTAPGAQKVALNICDDGKEYCKPVRYEIEVTAPKGYVADGEKTKILQPPKNAHEPVTGFVVNTPSAAQELARKEDKLLFIHFFGIWCPPCNILEEEVYPQPEFLEATTGMVRVMLDADSDISWAWKAHFKVGGYPTVIIANADLEEIDRLVGSRPTAAVVKWAAQAEANKAAPITKLLGDHHDPAGAEPDARKRIGMYYVARRDWDRAVLWLSDHPDADAKREAVQAKIEIAKVGNDESEVTKLTQQLTREYPGHVRFSSWVETLLGKKAPGAEKLVEPALKSLEQWRSSEELAGTGYSVADLWWKEGDLRKASGDDEGAKNAYRESASHYEVQAKSSNLEVARGANMERAYALHKAGDNEEARALYEELAAAYPREFSFNYNFAYVLNELEDREVAYEYVKKAEMHSYGDNWLRAVYLKAKIEKGLGKADAAAKTIDDALAEAVVPRSTDVRTHGYLRRLRTLRSEL